MKKLISMLSSLTITASFASFALACSDTQEKNNQGDGTENQGDGTENQGDGTENQGDGTENQGDGTENQGDGTENQSGIDLSSIITETNFKVAANSTKEMLEVSLLSEIEETYAYSEDGSGLILLGTIEVTNIDITNKTAIVQANESGLDFFNSKKLPITFYDADPELFPPQIAGYEIPIGVNYMNESTYIPLKYEPYNSTIKPSVTSSNESIINAKIQKIEEESYGGWYINFDTTNTLQEGETTIKLSYGTKFIEFTIKVNIWNFDNKQFTLSVPLALNDQGTVDKSTIIDQLNKDSYFDFKDNELDDGLISSTSAKFAFTEEGKKRFSGGFTVVFKTANATSVEIINYLKEFGLKFNTWAEQQQQPAKNDDQTKTPYIKKIMELITNDDPLYPYVETIDLDIVTYPWEMWAIHVIFKEEKFNQDETVQNYAWIQANFL